MSNQLLQLNKFDLSSVQLTPEIISIAKRESGMSWINRDTINKSAFNLDRIKEFKLDSLRINPKILIIGSNESKKKQVVESILSNQSIPCGIVITPTNSYNDIISPQFIHNIYNEEVVSNILHREQISDTRAYIVIDDNINENNKSILNLLYNSTHYHLTLIFAIKEKDAINISPEQRTRFDYVFLLEEETELVKRKIYDKYGGFFPRSRFDLFNQVFSQLTNDYGCMVFKCTESTDIYDKVFYFSTT